VRPCSVVDPRGTEVVVLGEVEDELAVLDGLGAVAELAGGDGEIDDVDVPDGAGLPAPAHAPAAASTTTAAVTTRAVRPLMAPLLRLPSPSTPQARDPAQGRKPSPTARRGFAS